MLSDQTSSKYDESGSENEKISKGKESSTSSSFNFTSKFSSRESVISKVKLKKTKDQDSVNGRASNSSGSSKPDSRLESKSFSFDKSGSTDSWIKNLSTDSGLFGKSESRSSSKELTREASKEEIISELSPKIESPNNLESKGKLNERAVSKSHGDEFGSSDEAPNLDVVSLGNSSDDGNLFSGFSVKRAAGPKQAISPFEDNERYHSSQIVCDNEIKCPYCCIKPIPGRTLPTAAPSKPVYAAMASPKSGDKSDPPPRKGILGQLITRSGSSSSRVCSSPGPGRGRRVIRLGNGVKVTLKGERTLLSMDNKVFEDHEEALMRLLGDSKFATVQSSYSNLDLLEDVTVKSKRLPGSREFTAKYSHKKGGSDEESFVKQGRKKSFWGRFWGNEDKESEGSEKVGNEILLVKKEEAEKEKEMKFKEKLLKKEEMKRKEMEEKETKRKEKEEKGTRKKEIKEQETKEKGARDKEAKKKRDTEGKKEKERTSWFFHGITRVDCGPSPDSATET